MNDLSEDEIKSKYLKAPTFEEIYEYMKELGVSGRQFERFFGLHEGIIKHIKNGTKNLPVKHWPIIYEKKVPLYGIAFNSEIPDSRLLKKVVPKKVPTVDNVIAHGRLNRVK